MYRLHDTVPSELLNSRVFTLQLVEMDQARAISSMVRPSYKKNDKFSYLNCVPVGILFLLPKILGCFVMLFDH